MKSILNKKTIALCIALIAILGALSACSDEESKQDGQTQVGQAEENAENEQPENSTPGESNDAAEGSEQEALAPMDGVPLDIPPYPAGSLDIASTIANLPQQAAKADLWNCLGGYWTATDNLFLAFVIRDGVYSIEFGYFETEWGCFGPLTNALPTGAYKATLSVHIPRQEANEVASAREEMDIDIFLDVSDYHVDGKIKAKIEIQANGGWYQYHWGGYSLQEAYDSIQ
ncbi:MAG: hypothetical protein FWG30_03220 [Eubacteriaceae bacterium]|nr:hypothetical protein [Eubacteriaceae bacterium]